MREQLDQKRLDEMSDRIEELAANGLHLCIRDENGKPRPLDPRPFAWARKLAQRASRGDAG
jgi:hypothetical protein